MMNLIGIMIKYQNKIIINKKLKKNLFLIKNISPLLNKIYLILQKKIKTQKKVA